MGIDGLAKIKNPGGGGGKIFPSSRQLDRAREIKTTSCQSLVTYNVLEIL